MNPQGNSDRQKWMRSLGLFTIILGDLLGFTGAGVGLGYLLWTHGKAPLWLAFVLGMLGMGLAFWRIYLLSKKELD